MQGIETYLEIIEGKPTIKEEFLNKLKELKKAKEEIDRELKTLSSSIVEELKVNYQESVSLGDYSYVVKRETYGSVFDEERFKQEQLELYMLYQKPIMTPQSYVLMSKRKGKENV